MIANIKYLGGSLLLNLLGFITAIAAVIALSYLSQISIFVFAAAFVGCLLISGSIAVRILLSDCISKRPWKESLAIEALALVFGLALNYAVLATATAWTGLDDMMVIMLSVIVGLMVLICGGWLYSTYQTDHHSNRFYCGVILWQSLSGILAMGFIACIFWTWSWLI